MPDVTIFTAENCADLDSICDKIKSLMREAAESDGSLMWSQMHALGERIKEFTKNPIVATSGCLPK